MAYCESAEDIMKEYKPMDVEVLFSSNAQQQKNYTVGETIAFNEQAPCDIIETKE